MLSRTIGTFGEVSVQVAAIGPVDAAVDLTIACMFQHEHHGALTGGLLLLDRALGGALTSLRREGVFQGRAEETLLLTKLPTSLPNQQLLIEGLGAPETFTPDVLQHAVSSAVQQALRMGARSAAFSPNLLDGGMESSGLTGIEDAMIRGLQLGLRAERRLVDMSYRPAPSLKAWLFEAGAAHFEAVASRFEENFRALNENP
jgi:hypothetical protein